MFNLLVGLISLSIAALIIYFYENSEKKRRDKS